MSAGVDDWPWWERGLWIPIAFVSMVVFTGWIIVFTAERNADREREAHRAFAEATVDRMMCERGLVECEE